MEEIVQSNIFMFPLFMEIQESCLIETIEYLDSFAIPSYDEDRLREWIRAATSLQGLLESLVVQAYAIWLHATTRDVKSGLINSLKEVDLQV